jgi:hypothetical protein
MSISLTISAESVQEFSALLAQFAQSGLLTTPEAAPIAAPATQAPATAARKTKKVEDTSPVVETVTAVEDTAPVIEAAPVVEVAAPVEAVEVVAATPSASSPVTAAAEEAGEVTIQQLKDAMAELLKSKSASVAMQVLDAATGCKSLTSGSPSVVERAKEDPTIFRKTLDALIAAKSAA